MLFEVVSESVALFVTVFVTLFVTLFIILFVTIQVNSTVFIMGDEVNHDWELSKENIQPIKQGRVIGALMMGLDLNAQPMLNKKRKYD